MDDEREQDLSHIHWSWPEAIAANPARSLANADLAMDYFSFSPFWDSKSNNNVLRTQRRIEQPNYGSAEEKVELTAFRTGFEYVVAHARAPDLFVIHRRPVLPDGGRGAVTHAYFILQDRVYMSPNLHHIVNTRLRNATSLLTRTFDALERSHPPANPRAASVWRAGAPKEKKKEQKDEEKDAEAAGGEVEAGAGGQGQGQGGQTQVAGQASREPAAASADAPAPDWHLFNALAATRAALPGLNALAASARPAHDDAAEAKTLEALAASTVRPQAAAGGAGSAAPPAVAGAGAAGFGAGNVASGTPLALQPPTPASFGALLTASPNTMLTPPRPRMGSISLGLVGAGAGSRPGSNFAPSLPAESPNVS